MVFLPRVAPENAPDSEEEAFPRPVFFYCLLRILRTGGVKNARGP